MLKCSIKGCIACVSETLSPPEIVKRWITITADEWPNLDWWAFGGVDKVTFCPTHRTEIFDEIVRQRGLDPSMNPGGGPNPSNRH
jgi:hypothetical protein